MARSGMTNLITRLRNKTNEPTTTVFTDNEMQTFLDAHRVNIYQEPLMMERTLVSATDYEYKVFRSRYGDLEEVASGSAIFKLEDAAGTQRGTATYSADYETGVITMTADQNGTALYLTARSYDLAGAAADVWMEKAGVKADYYDVSGDGHSLNRSQWFQQCTRMSDYFKTQARAVSVRAWRVGDFEAEH